ncbi:hypothetical protein C3K47_10260 [Solitalea longa]|uniref:DUF479 domain-containing protein n=1 Tax=Solitalea longa TaxID=2079460 RepID=A0A2S5A3P2_9SPHI|nr:hypothetical protein [Solitalea longa]POY36733.1 hypothetical protein C3K47_10260 [Solitalea longa]
MNFLSHYYFDKDSVNAHFVLGLVLPDLTKNFNKTWNIHPHKFIGQLSTNAQLMGIYEGWQKHLQVDKLFHSSGFFKQETDRLKQLITPLLIGTPVRPFILAHIALELMLDSLLIENKKVDTNNFYLHLSAVDQNKLLEYLRITGINQPENFLNFYNKFVEHAYLHSYTDYNKLVYALNRICYRVWGTNFSEETKTELEQVLLQYKTELISNFMDIFDEITPKL